MGLFSKKTILDAGSNEQFIEFLYEIMMGRKADEGGKSHYLNSLSTGSMTRQDVVTAFACSEEFQLRQRILYDVTDALFDYVDVYTGDIFDKHVQDDPYTEYQLCELVNPRRWLEDEWRAYQRELTVIPMSLQQIHRKGWEWTHTMIGLDKLGMLGDDKRCLGVGAGHEALAYWLATKTGEVVATDLYEGSWSEKGSREGDPSVLDDPKQFAPFEYPEDRLTFLRMDGTKLEFEDNSFDVVFSISSIEHFGGHDASARSMAEIGRVLKPGGMAAIVTECIIGDQTDKEFFRIDELEKYIVAPSGLKLIQKPTWKLPRKALERPTEMPDEQNHTPHLVLKNGKLLYTSVLFFLRKF